ncbi:hypothetical protein EJ110_NYTH34976 [Nymphaea thermarum]|nr:hypothetical protein EJ110_NYTH34976 [Nymphaea thermarum]
MAVSSSSTVNTNQTEIGAYRSENVPVQVITLCLTKENYFTWSAAMTMGIAGRGRIAYIDGRNPEPARTSDYYGALKAKWDELDYYSEIPLALSPGSCM